MIYTNEEHRPRYVSVHHQTSFNDSRQSFLDMIIENQGKRDINLRIGGSAITSAKGELIS